MAAAAGEILAGPAIEKAGGAIKAGLTFKPPSLVGALVIVVGALLVYAAWKNLLSGAAKGITSVASQTVPQSKPVFALSDINPAFSQYFTPPPSGGGGPAPSSGGGGSGSGGIPDASGQGGGSILGLPILGTYGGYPVILGGNMGTATRDPTGAYIDTQRGFAFFGPDDPRWQPLGVNSPGVNVPKI